MKKKQATTLDTLPLLNRKHEMTDPLKGKYCKKHTFKREFELAKQRLASLGGQVVEGVHDYEAFTYEIEGLKLIFYPHKTSANNHHIRIRSVGKTDKSILRKAIFLLAENSCTFQYPMDRQLHNEAVTNSLKA